MMTDNGFAQGKKLETRFGLPGESICFSDKHLARFAFLREARCSAIMS
ncbi:MAG: hypothetical protein ACYTAO_00665 [Planctomycetota bacterium]|jgi:hypothetical protein